MSRLLHVLKEEPTALGTLIASLAPVLVLVGVIDLDENGISGIVIAVNALVGFVVRLLVVPSAKVRAVTTPSAASPSAPPGGSGSTGPQ